YGKYAPDFVQAVMEAYKSCTHVKAGADPREAGGDAPPFNASARTDAANGDKSAVAPTPWNGQGPNARPLPESAGAGTSDDGGLKRATFNAHVGDRSLDGGQTRDANGITLGNPTASATNGAKQNRADAAAKETGDDCTTQFRRMEQRLRELGATYYLLETW